MKKSLNNSANLSAAQLEELTTLTQETLAYNVTTPKYPIFTSADLWNIQKSLRSRNQRRYF